MSVPDSAVPNPPGDAPSSPDDRTPYQHLDSVPFWVIHLLAAYGLYRWGVSLPSLALCFGLFFARMFGVTGGYHRYFSHRTFKTGRVFQFLLAWLAVSSSQKGVLWWASHHRVHHKHSDQAADLHSPVQRGFWFSHVGWLFDPISRHTKTERIQDFAKYPELRFLDTFWLLPPVLTGVLCFLLLGAQGLFIGFFLSTVLLWHATFTINSLSHVIGKRRFATDDDSRNNWALALLTLGEGWHNNHHHYQSSARNGFYWWEVDVTFYVLFALSKLGLVWDLRPVPAHVLEEGRKIDAARREGIEPPPFVPQMLEPAE